MEKSPYLKYEDFFLSGMFSAERKLQLLLLGFYDPKRFCFRKADFWGDFDARQRAIYQELAIWHHKHGNEPTFVALCNKLISRGEAHAKIHLAGLIRLREMTPRDFGGEWFGRGVDYYNITLHTYESIVLEARKDGFLRD